MCCVTQQKKHFDGETVSKSLLFKCFKGLSLSLKCSYFAHFIAALRVFLMEINCICQMIIRTSCKVQRLVETLQQVNTFLLWDVVKEWPSNYCVHTYLTFRYLSCIDYIQL